NPHTSSHGPSGAELTRLPLNAPTSNQKSNCNAKYHRVRLCHQRTAVIHTSDPLAYAAISLGNGRIDIFDHEPDARRHMDRDGLASARISSAWEDLVGIPIDAEPVTSFLDLY
ncbi:hypothetical protein, partial [Bradyrhizobium sp. 146]|uniref:hypothetical protein n=1 Tax=Bradyrhizobium sp. 146 TaxID=2782622 RepID=UPI001FF8C689